MVGETREKIRRCEYIDIWSLVSADQVSIDKERSFERNDKKVKVAKTFGNWLQAFLVLAHETCRLQREKGPELMVYMDTIFSAHKLRGGSVWWKYEEEFRRQSLVRHVGYTMRDTAVFMPHANVSMNAQYVGEHTPQCGVSGDKNRILDWVLPVQMRSPVKKEALLYWLDRYYKREEAKVLQEGFCEGFRIPFQFSAVSLFSSNLKSIEDKKDIVKEKLMKEVELGRMAGPFSVLPIENLRVSPLGLVPKKEPGKYRLIHHLSFSQGLYVNDGISKEEVSYTSFDRAIFLVKQAGKGALLVKSDIEAAFRLLPLHVDCIHLLGCHLDGEFFVDMCLPMGCSISCFYFEMFSCYLEWLLKWETGLCSLMHYLDDFWFVGPGDSKICD
ncbi:uncharacterized protein [Phyllobates terribilis]|uniref:uncharacterized protein n=1 Tax=Phyllobates terribilis TaxID=111132 RepID=UPI003CCB3099